MGYTQFFPQQANAIGIMMRAIHAGGPADGAGIVLGIDQGQLMMGKKLIQIHRRPPSALDWLFFRIHHTAMARRASLAAKMRSYPRSPSLHDKIHKQMI
ncbi:hypothetical protein GRI97_05345 [Altererythrobacter xixiisoli]|uniref:Uncharacterized protein n=1 Tax=Croceibacterium xixiisoli TaxID=1476466 RepID=A0A6I4TSV7_9SPHN|nr:hypothetical protein [Croceibacterium xixiisoli]MXO98409.1 hypothetical protein [Croceibacterium xixiisoli]